MAFPGADLPMLNMEKRTGVKDGEVEDFISRASDVQNKIADLVSGKISVEEIEAEQAKEAEEQARHDAERQRHEQVLGRGVARGTVGAEPILER